MEPFEPEPYKPGESLMAYRMYIASLVHDGLIPPPPQEWSTYFFFYGTLALPHILKQVLQLDEEPEYKKGRILGRTIKMWGSYPALVPLESNPPVEFEGRVWYGDEVRDLDRLKMYKGASYKATKVSIMLEGDRYPVVGWTFVWDGDLSELQDGTFDPYKFAEKSS
ncbi:hypothetical protein AX16_010803 [Volvariella volvacea WC 439]|nr:hypothetical protein AX16_010803 [Volvariella volvacea WC 439]